MAGRVSTALNTFWRWWTEELKGLLPRSALAARNRPARRFVIAVEGPLRTLLLEQDGQTQAMAQGGQAEGSLGGLADAARARPELAVGLRFGAADCFSRTVQLPAQAESDFGRILELDMERTTPFRASDVLTAFYVVPDASVPRGQRALRHVVIKRKTIDPVLRQMHDLGLEPAFADCWDQARRGGLPVDFLAATRTGAGRDDSGWVRAAAVVAVLLTASAVAIPIMRNGSALETLEARTEAARTEAASVRTAVEASQTAAAQIGAMERRLRSRLPVARVVEELTAIMPDTAWVADLRIEGDVIEFNGFAKSAAALIPALEASPLFAEATLTSPVVLDGTEDKERFSVRLRLSFGDRTANAVPAASAQEAAEQ